MSTTGAACSAKDVAESYGIPQDFVYGMPVITNAGEYELVQGLEIDAFSRERMNATLKELEEERAGVASLLG